MSKPFPPLDTDEDARAFVAEADLTDYDLSGGKVVHYEFGEDLTDLRLRMPQRLLEALKTEADRAGLSYRQFIRQTLESAVKANG